MPSIPTHDISFTTRSCARHIYIYIYMHIQHIVLSQSIAAIDVLKSSTPIDVLLLLLVKSVHIYIYMHFSLTPPDLIVYICLEDHIPNNFTARCHTMHIYYIYIYIYIYIDIYIYMQSNIHSTQVNKAQIPIIPLHQTLHI